MEQVFALPEKFIKDLVRAGIHRGNESELLTAFAAHGAFYDRTQQFENDLGLRQIIPYVVARCKDKILVYQRTPKQTDARLHTKFSIGFGGHINPIDAEGGQNPILAARTRELNEEISFGSPANFSFIGTINVQRVPIDAVHVGVAYFAQLDSEAFEINEVGYFASTAWKTPAELIELHPQMETWSQVLVESLYLSN